MGLRAVDHSCLIEEQLIISGWRLHGLLAKPVIWPEMILYIIYGNLAVVGPEN